MTTIRQLFKSAVAALALAASGAVAGAEDLDPLFEALRSAEGEAAEQIAGRIWEEWSETGSPAMNLLLNRGREALEKGDADLAIEHFTALVDHAPDFPEGYNGRATAYFQKRQFGPSLEDIRRALELNPRHFGAMSGLALIMEEIGRPEDSLAAWREVQKLNPMQRGLSDALLRLERQVEGETL